MSINIISICDFQSYELKFYYVFWSSGFSRILNKFKENFIKLKRTTIQDKIGWNKTKRVWKILNLIFHPKKNKGGEYEIRSNKELMKKRYDESYIFGTLKNINICKYV
jgi:hypothetical protein